MASPGVAPAGVGNGQFWSQDMADYYAKWIEVPRSAHGLDIDAIGCRNEKGVSIDFIKKLKATLNAAGLRKVKVHGFDNWDRTKWDWIPKMSTDAELRNAVRRREQSHHGHLRHPRTTSASCLDSMNKPIWNSEEHVYKDGFDCEISLVQAFNENFLVSGVTKIVNWYLVGSRLPPRVRIPSSPPP